MTDDGVGMAPDGRRGHGLDNLYSRARGAGGTVTIDSRPDHGTAPVWAIPRGRV